MADCETAKLYLLSEIKEISASLKIEKLKLVELQRELEDQRENDDVAVEKSKSRKRIRQIEKLRGKVQDLTTECKSLDKVMAAVERDNQNQNNKQQGDDIRRALQKVVEDIGFVDDELYELEKRVKTQKDINLCLEKDLKKEAMLQQANMDAIAIDNRRPSKAEELLMDVLLGIDCLVSRNGDDIFRIWEKVQQLKEESAALYSELLNLQRDKEEFYNTFEKEQDFLISQMTNEIIKAETDISRVESQMEDIRKIAQEMEEERKTVDHLRREEEEAVFALEVLTNSVKKGKDELRSLNWKLNALKLECQDEERRNLDIITEIGKLDKMKAAQDEEEKARLRKIPHAAN